MLPEVIRPYSNHPLVANKPTHELENLDNKELNDVIRAEDIVIRGVREYYLNDERERRLTPGQFSSSILIARGLAFLDVAHYNKNIMEINNDVFKITPTTAKRESFNKNMRESVIKRLLDSNLIELTPDKQYVQNCIPYAVGSKIFVKKNLLEIPRLYEEQINHFHVIRNIQDFPEVTSELQSNSPNSHTFNRDYNALEEIDVIRPQSIKGIDYTFAKSFLTGEKSTETWETVLDSTDTVRMGLKSLMDLQGDYGGFISHSEIAQTTGWNQRAINRLMRTVDTIGIAQRTHTLEMEDALSRPTAGTLLNMNYHELNNAQSILVLTRSVPVAPDILYKLQTESELKEEDLMDEFGITPVQKVRNTLQSIGVVSRESLYEGVLKLVPFRGHEQFLSDVLAVSAHTRHVLEPDRDVTRKLEPTFKDFDEDKLRKESKQIKLDFFEAVHE